MQRLQLLVRTAALAADLEQRPAEPLQRRQGYVLGQAPVEEQRLRLAVLRSKPQPRVDGASRVVGREGLTVEAHAALVHRVHARDQAQYLAAARADEAAEADDLPRSHL